MRIMSHFLLTNEIKIREMDEPKKLKIREMDFLRVIMLNPVSFDFCTYF